MIGYIDKIKEISERLLKDGTVDAVIGYRKGITVSMMNEPCIIKNADDVKDLVWDANCRINLTTYLSGRKEKLASLQKGVIQEIL